MLAIYSIELFQTPCPSSISFYFLKDENLRSCVNYRELNSVKIKGFYPISCMYKNIENPGSNDDFQPQTRIVDSNKSKSSDKMTISLCFCDLSYSIKSLCLFMYFPLVYTLGAFQQTMDLLLTWVKEQEPLICLDDPVFIWLTPKEYTDHGWEVLTLVSYASVKFEPQEMRYLHEIHWLCRFYHLPWAVRTAEKNNWHHTQNVAPNKQRKWK